MDLIWHLLNFVAPALAVGAVTSTLAKLAWRRELAGRGWGRLLAWAGVAGVLGLVAALLATGRDGTLAGYALMVVASALGLWFGAFVRR